MTDKQQQPPEEIKSANSFCEAVETAVKTGQAAAETAAIALGAIGSAGAQIGAAAAASAGEAAGAAAKQAQDSFDNATGETGKVLEAVAQNPVLRQFLKFFRAEGLLTLIGEVDLASVEAAVQKLQQEYPTETKAEIARRIVADKAIYAGTIGLATSVVPGVALALLAVDLVATTQLQAQMVYQVAAAYGMDLRAPARRSEVLAVFGLSAGSLEVLKLGFGLLRNVPLAGMAIGASTNAAMFYAVGYAACQFYEAKVNSATSDPATETMGKASQQ
ncbi:MAG: hypothetical protein HC786_05105 [Richelia sp. CSU_2_1]|nr:hypothetical protein [Richelia sp. CSU_2_1]